MSELQPFRLEPYFRTRIWGFNDLAPWYEYKTEGEPIGEVWLTGEMCKVATGPLAGLTLTEITQKLGRGLLGSAYGTGEFPLLIKLLFPKEKLSVQVHPDDAMAQKYGEPRGKTECWYALAAEPGAEVAAGLKAGVTLEQVEREVTDGTLEESLEILPVAAGDMVYVDAGTVHAIWPGSVLLETQQNCDLTYRLFDYGRPRELHVAKALEATRLQTSAGKELPLELADRTVLVDREYFCVEKIRVDGTRTGKSMGRDLVASTGTDSLYVGGGDAGSLQYLFAAAGSAKVAPIEAGDFGPLELPARGIVAVPAASPEWQIEDLGGLELIRITPRFPAEQLAGAA